jgi:sortase A
MECVSDGIRRVVRVLGLLMIVVGLGAAAWGLVVWRWQDPFTAAYTTYEQHKLAHRYQQQAEQFLATAPHEATHRSVGHAAPPQKQLVRKVQSVAGEELVIDRAARRYRLSAHTGDPVGRIKVPRMGLDIIVVNGTDESSLERGPGRELHTFMPGEGRLVYIAGHRTTYLAPFSHIDALRRGDRITLELPYATFVYRVTRHVIVTADDLAVLRPGSHEVLALQACHPRFFATHRYIVYARPVKVIPAPGLGPAYTPLAGAAAA